MSDVIAPIVPAERVGVDLNDNQRLMDHMVTFARKSFEDPKCTMLPMWTLLCDNGEIIPVMAIFRNEEEKYATVDLIKQMVKDKGVNRIGFLSETWMSSYQGEDAKKKPRDLPKPSDDPNRKEGILFIVEDRFGGKICCTIPINRDEDNNATLGEIKVMPDFTGDMATFFEKRETMN